VSLDDLLRGEVAEDVLRALHRQLLERRRNGRARPVWADEVYRALSEAAGLPAPSGMSSGGHASGTVVDMGFRGVLTREAAQLVDRSQRQVSRLCESGQVRSFRVGRDYLVDLDSLRTVLGRTA
jgi:hypothetical protein